MSAPGKRIHRAWLVMIGMLLIYASMIGMLTNCLGIVFSKVIEELGFGAGDLSLYYMLRSFASALSVSVTVKWFFTRNAKLVMAVLGAVYSLSIGAMCFYTQLWQWYLSAVAAGIGMSCVMVSIPIVLNNWFHTKNGLVIGVTMSGSGVAGALFSPVCSKLIVAFGWRTTCLIMMGIGFVLIVLPSLFLLESSPQKAGCEPYGAGSREIPAADTAPKTPAAAQTPSPGIFAACAFIIVLAGNLVQFNNQLPTFAQTVGYSITVGALLTSCSMVGNLLSKLALGIMTDRIGIYRALSIFLVVQVCAMLCFLFLAQIPAMLYLGTVLYGTVYSISVTTPSLLFLAVYGSENYRGKLSRMQAINNILAAILSAVFPYIYDFTGSFRPVFVYGAVACIISLALCQFLYRYSRRGADPVQQHSF